MSDNKKAGFGDLGKGVADIAKAATGAAVTGATALGSAGRSGGNMLSGAAGLAGRTLSGAAGFMKRHPKVTFVVGLYAALKGVSSIVNKHKQNKAAAEAVAEASPTPQSASYDPQAFVPAEQAPAAPSAAPQQASPEIPAEQMDALRQMLQAQSQASAPAPEQQQTNWAQQIDQERQQKPQGTQIGG